MHALTFYTKNYRKHLAIAVKDMDDAENRISFIKDVAITDRKTDIIHAALSNEIEKGGGVESLSDLEVMGKV